METPASASASGIIAGLIDYGAGNLRSVDNSLKSMGVDPRIVKGPGDLEGVTHLVLPGVGAFGDCAAKLEAMGLGDAIRAWIAADRPFLGICVGYQVLFDSSEESPGARGLGVFRGRVVKFASAPGHKVPHMGWNSVEVADSGDPVWQGMPMPPWFYFVHSYYPEVADEKLVAATCTYGLPFAAAIRSGKLFATQFHPEKSQANGLTLMANFLATPA